METLILGFVLGLIVSPVLRSWIVWREYRAASREARLADLTLKWLEQDASSEEPSSSEKPRSI